MISFIIALLALVAGYFFYGKLVEKVFGPDDRPTPAVSKADGVDYIVLPGWKVFMIQFLNIAGTGPIFGAIMGAWYGPMAYLWIVLGCIFAGAVHDYMSGMLSMRHGGAGLPELVGATRLDAIRTQPLYDVSKVAGYTTDHVTGWVDNMGLMKDLMMNRIGCQIYPGPIAGDIILTLEDAKYNPKSFRSLDRLKKAVVALGANSVSVNLDDGPDDDGRYDAWS